MISSYRELTVKYIRVNKKRSVLTIVGIILSVALISCIGFFINGLQETEIESIKDNYGEFHIMYKNLNDDLFSKITSNPKVSRSGLVENDEVVQLSKNVKLIPMVATNKALELIPYRIKEGTMPKNKNEIAVQNWILPYVNKNIRIGDKININGRHLKLVGILDDNMLEQGENSGVMLSVSNNIDMKKASLLVEISKKTNLKSTVEELEGMTDKNNVTLNSDLIDVEGGGRANGNDIVGLYSTFAVIIGIVIIATIAVIYNSFQISMVERIRQFGLLRAVGMTPKQLRKIVFKEATILAAIGIPIGLLIGVIAIQIILVVFRLIGAYSIINIKIPISPFILIVSSLVGITSVYLSAMLPTIFAGRVSPLISINSRGLIVREKLKKRRSFVFKKIFKFEGELAVKNIKRNKKRYRITVFSIVISVVLFVTFKSFMDMYLNVSDKNNESKNINFSIYNSSTDEKDEINDKIVDNIGKLDSVGTIYRKYVNFNFTSKISSSQEIQSIKNLNNIYISKDNKGKEMDLIPAYVNIYDDNSLEVAKKYLKTGNINKNKIDNGNGVILIEKNMFTDKNKKYHNEPIANIKVGDEIEVNYNPVKDKISMGSGPIKKVKIMAILKDDPFDYISNENKPGLKFITTREVVKNLTGINDISPNKLDIELKNVKDEEKAKGQLEDVIRENSSLQLYNILDENRKSKSAILMIQILIYGFVVVVSLIGSVNIVNTITTNIILRKKEFGALKAIGLTQKGLRKMIILEGLLYGIIGTIYGSIISCILSYIMYRGIGGARQISWEVPWMGIFIAGSAALIIGYLSVLAPLSRINKENLIEVIREDY